MHTAVDAKHHLVVAHEVTSERHDRTQLATMAARDAMGKQKLLAIADRGYFSGLRSKACSDAGIDATILPKPMPSGAKFDGRFTRPDISGAGSQPFVQLVPVQRSPLLPDRQSIWR